LNFIATASRDGCPIGISVDLPPSDGLHPRKDAPRGAKSDSAGGSVGHGNYPSSIPSAECILQKLVDEEVRKGWMKEIEQFEPGCRRAKMALVPKKSYDGTRDDYASLDARDLKKFFRIIEDYRRNHTNDEVAMCETNAVPGYSSLAALLSGIASLSETTGKRYAIFESDVETAYRIVPIIKEEQKHLGIQIGERKFINTRLPMGLKSSAYIWCREYSSIHRAARILMQAAGCAGLCLLDDNFWALLEEIKGEGAAILLLVPGACGIPFGWHKLRLSGDINT
ncbi:hypothetical protein FOZ63_016211, partial [Perkinsus olseni]